MARTPLHFRRATADDAERLARGAVQAVEESPSFAPPGWTAPSPEEEAARLRELLPDDDVWCLLAEDGAGLAGQITILPAARAAHAVDDAALAHLRNLFVRRDLWGTGLAGELHAAAIEAARERGYTQLRLFTPAAQCRARRFYEREGWGAAGEASHDAALGLEIVEYRFAVGPEPPAQDA